MVRGMKQLRRRFTRTEHTRVSRGFPLSLITTTRANRAGKELFHLQSEVRSVVPTKRGVKQGFERQFVGCEALRRIAVSRSDGGISTSECRRALRFEQAAGICSGGDYAMI